MSSPMVIRSPNFLVSISIAYPWHIHAGLNTMSLT
jgi:hypothetical protein